MKIIFLARYLPAEGSTTHMYTVAESLIKRNNEVYILSRGPGDDLNAIKLFEKAKKNGVQSIELPFPLYSKITVFTRFQQLFSYIYVTPFALYQLFKLKPDVIHAHYPVTTYIASIFRFLTGKAFIVTHHISNIPKHIFNRKANYVIAISRELEASLMSYYTYEKEQVKLIFNGVKTQKNNIDSHTIKQLNEKYSIPKNTVIFGFVGTLGHRKGTDILLKAIEKSKHLNIHVIILGDGNRVELQQYINENQIKDIITLIPFRDPNDIYNMIDVLILPSRIEGFPLVPLEAMMLKKPVIRSKVQGAHDQIIEGKNGFLFESENFSQLADIIKEITLKPEILNELGENAYHHAITNFSEDLMVDKLLDVYELAR